MKPKYKPGDRAVFNTPRGTEFNILEVDKAKGLYLTDYDGCNNYRDIKWLDRVTIPVRRTT
jgi:hypothetical protein